MSPPLLTDPHQMAIKPFVLLGLAATYPYGLITKPHHLPHPWTCLTYDAKQHPYPIRRFSTMNWTD